jgi:2-polyprenyl-3-methyl-5-hydroxy-6-metoxy-1,4-benzoquinol methylase
MSKLHPLLRSLFTFLGKWSFVRQLRRNNRQQKSDLQQCEVKKLYKGDRNNYFCQLARDKEILHVGCTDFPFTEDRVINGTLLHSQLEKVAKKIIGIDLSEESISILKSHGIYSVMVMNAEKILLEQDYDLIIAGDVIEHLSNPGLFLQQVPHLLRSDGILVISVPSAFSFISSLWLWISGNEHVHLDHCYYFSPKTLTQLCNRYQLFPISLVYLNVNWNPNNLISTIIFYFRNLFLPFSISTASEIIMCFKLKRENCTE